MEAKVFYDNVMSTAKLAEFSAEQSVETEILLADYDAPVFKIVKTTMEHAVTQKYVTKNKLVLEGFIKLCVFYQPPGGEKLSVITQRIPFQKQHELQQEHSELNYIRVEGICQYVNTRPQNPTRIDVRGAYMFNVRLYGASEFKTVTAASGNTVCCNSENLECFSMSGQNIRQFTIEDELELPENTQKILQVKACTPQPLVSTYQDKITVKGEAVTEIFYTVQDSFEIKKYSHTFLYNQIMDMQGIKENHIAYADIAVTNIAVSYNSDSKKYIANVTVQIDASSFSKQQIIAVTDAFSRCFDYTKTEKEVMIDKNIYQMNKNQPVKFTAQLGKGVQVKHIIFEPSPLKYYYEINKMTAKSKLTAHIITVNSQQEYECLTHTEDVVLPWLESCTQYDELLLRLNADAYTFSQTEEAVSIDAAVSVQGFVIEKSPVRLLDSFEENTENPVDKQEEALVIYYAQKGEKVFGIAKQHCADPKMIMTENELNADTISENRMIFIPVFEQ